MANLLRTRLTAIWLILLAVTLFSWQMGHGAARFGPRLSGAAILVAAFVKARFVLLDFMELRNAPLLLRAVIEVWAFVMCTVLIVLLAMTPR